MYPVAGEAVSQCDGAWTPPHTPGLCQLVARSKTSGWCRGSPTGCGSLDWDSPSTGATHTANPKKEMNIEIPADDLVIRRDSKAAVCHACFT